MANVIIVNSSILLTYLPYFTTFLPTYLPTTTYLPTHPPTYLVTYYNLLTYPPTYLSNGLSTPQPTHMN
jgi:hypothetical protein